MVWHSSVFMKLDVEICGHVNTFCWVHRFINVLTKLLVTCSVFSNMAACKQVAWDLITWSTFWVESVTQWHYNALFKSVVSLDSRLKIWTWLFCCHHVQSSWNIWHGKNLVMINQFGGCRDGKLSLKWKLWPDNLFPV